MRTGPLLGHADRSDAARGDAMTEDQLLAELGRLYFLEDVSKVELGRRFNLSRFKVARMLAKGRERGIIRIEIHEPTQNLPEYADPLKTTLGLPMVRVVETEDRKSTRLNSSHVSISYAVFCLKKKTKEYYRI